MERLRVKLKPKCTIFTIETYAAAHKRIVKQRDKAEKKAAISPMAVEEYYRLTNLHERILQRLDREISDWEWHA